MKNNNTQSLSLNSMMIASISGLSFILGLFTILLFGATKWEDHLNDQMKVYVYLEDSLSVSTINATIVQLKNHSSINKMDVKYVSKETTAKDFLTSSHENFDELLGDENPFKNLVVLGIKPENNTELKLNKLVNQFKVLDGVYDVSYPINIFSKLTPKIKVLSSLGIILITILSFWIYFQIANYIRLNIHANRMVIKSMQLLGSTNSFIKKPYIYNSMVLGFLGSLLGYILINGLLYYVTIEIPEIKNIIFDMTCQLNLFGINLLFCLLFCLISTLLALNKYLKISQVNLA